MELQSLPYLEASLEDFHEGISRSSPISSMNKRHSVLLFEEAFEFLFYQKLVLLGIDVYKTGQYTIGTDKAIELVKGQGITPLFLNSIRRVQKLRGDAKHHAQVPTDREYTNLLEKLQVSYSAFLFENFCEDLGHEVADILPIEYSKALHIHSEYLKAHQALVASRQLVCACIHKVKGLLDDKSVLRTWIIQDMDDLSSILESLAEKCIDLPMPPEAKEAMRDAMSMIEKSVEDENYVELYERVRMTYGLVDEILPSDFELATALKITDRLVMPRNWRGLDMRTLYAPHAKGDSQLFDKLLADIGELLQSPSITSQLPRPRVSSDGDERVPFWKFAVFDGYKWHTFSVDLRDYTIFVELGDLEDPVSFQRRESVAQAIHDELLKAKEG